MNKTQFALTCGAALLLSLHQPAEAQLEVGGDLMDECGKIEGLVKADQYPEARSAARACLEALEGQLETEIAAQFPDDVAGWKRSGFEQNKAMGFSNTSATYAKGGTRVEVSLIGGASGSALGAFSGLAAMGMMQGKQVRVAGLPAAVNPDGTILVTLESGGFLSFESGSFDTADAALEGMGELVDAFPVGRINALLKDGG
jgi:hypothetical protein